MYKNKFYNGFSKEELNSLPINYRLLTHFTFNSNIVTSDLEAKHKGIEVLDFNGKILSSEKPFSPISKIIDFE